MTSPRDAIDQRYRWLELVLYGPSQSQQPRHVVISTSGARGQDRRTHWRERESWRLPDLRDPGGRGALMAKSAELGALGQRSNVYITPRTFTGARRTNQAALPSHALWADCDTPDSLERLRRCPIAPHIILSTGRPDGGRHAYWLLDRPAPPDALAHFGARLADLLASDPAAARPAQPSRVPLTRNFKWPGAPTGQIWWPTPAETRYTLDQLAQALPRRPAQRRQAPPSAPPGGGPRSELKTALKAIPPHSYVAALTGREIEPGDYVLCPFPHPRSPSGHDRNPSLRIHHDGWHCYGCGRHGDIIALESELSGLGPAPTGRDYREILDRLAHRFGINPEAPRGSGAAPPRPGAPATDRGGARPLETLELSASPPAQDLVLDRRPPAGRTLALAGGWARIALPWLRSPLAATASAIAALLTLLLTFIIVAGATVLLHGAPGAGQRYEPSGQALRDIPHAYLRLLRAAGTRYRLDWAVLAAVSKIECDHGRSRLVGCHPGEVNASGAGGPAQFLAASWRRYGVDADGDGRRDRWDPADAIYGMANYLHAAGAPSDYRRALFAYNHALWYVEAVLAQADSYRGAYTGPSLPTHSALAAARRLLTSPGVIFSNPLEERDIAQGRIDRRVLGTLVWISQRHSVLITALRSDHRRYTEGGTVSNHAEGRAVDIGAVDGRRCTGTRAGSCGRLTLQLSDLPAPLHSSELIYCFDSDGPRSPDAFARPDHCDHVHIGYDT